MAGRHPRPGTKAVRDALASKTPPDTLQAGVDVFLAADPDAPVKTARSIVSRELRTWRPA